jgi:rubrerythrin
MTYDFNADEIFQMAEEIERNGADFYRTAAKSISDPKQKDLLNHLAEMEVNHEKRFSELRKSLSDKEKAQTIFDPNDDSALYLKALADTRVFFNKELDFSSMKQILRGAIEAEKDSIVFYVGMRKAVPDQMGKNKIESIIEEEMGHIRLLSKEILTLK